MDEPTDPAFDSGDAEGSRDYADVGEAARQLGGPAPLPGGEKPIHPIEESEEVAAAVADEAPVPDLAEGAQEEPSSSRSTRPE